MLISVMAEKPTDPRHPVYRNSYGECWCTAIVRQSLAGRNSANAITLP